MGGGGGRCFALVLLFDSVYIGSHFSNTEAQKVSVLHGVDCASVEPPGYLQGTGLTHFPAHYFISGCADSVYSCILHAKRIFYSMITTSLNTPKNPLFIC